MIRFRCLLLESKVRWTQPSHWLVAYRYHTPSAFPLEAKVLKGRMRSPWRSWRRPVFWICSDGFRKKGSEVKPIGEFQFRGRLPTLPGQWLWADRRRALPNGDSFFHAGAAELGGGCVWGRRAESEVKISNDRSLEMPSRGPVGPEKEVSEESCNPLASASRISDITGICYPTHTRKALIYL